MSASAPLARAASVSRRRLLGPLAASAAGVAALAGCSPFPTPGAQPGGKEPVTLRLVWQATEAELPEPLGFAANFLAAEAEAVINQEMRKAVLGEVQYDGGFFQNLANQVQLILDKPPPAAPKEGVAGR